MKVLIVDDHPLIVEGIAAVLGELDQAARAVSAGDGTQALRTFGEQGPFDLVILDTLLPGHGGVELIRRLRSMDRETPIVALSAHDTRQAVLDVLHAGARGFISKLASTRVLMGALKLVLSGGVYIPPQVLEAHAGETALEPQSAPGRPTRNLGLTDRQTEVLALLVEGKPNKLICRELNVSEGTVKTHVSAIFRTLNVSNRAQVAYALNKLGLPLPQRCGAAVEAGSAALVPARLPAPQHE